MNENEEDYDEQSLFFKRLNQLKCLHKQLVEMYILRGPLLAEIKTKTSMSLLAICEAGYRDVLDLIKDETEGETETKRS